MTRKLLLQPPRPQLQKRRLSPQNQPPRPRSQSQRQPKQSLQRNPRRSHQGNRKRSPRRSHQGNRKRSPRRSLTRSPLQSQQQNLTANRKARQPPPHNLIGRKSPNISPDLESGMMVSNVPWIRSWLVIDFSSFCLLNYAWIGP